MKIYAVREPVFSGPTPSFQNVSNDIPLVIDNGIIIRTIFLKWLLMNILYRILAVKSWMGW